MGIFDPSNGASSRKPVDLVGRYQSQMQRAAYSPTVAQAAARSGISPTMATRIAAREVGGQMSGALPGLLSQEAQMMEARRVENDQKERQNVAMGLNIGGQVLGTVVDAYAPGAGQIVRSAASEGGNAYVGGAQHANARVGQAALATSYATPAQSNFQGSGQPVAQAPLMQAPAPVAVTQYAPPNQPTSGYTADGYSTGSAPNAAGGVGTGALVLPPQTPVNLQHTPNRSRRRAR